MAGYTFLGLQATAWTGIQAILTGIGLIAILLLFLADESCYQIYTA